VNTRTLLRPAIAGAGIAAASVAAFALPAGAAVSVQSSSPAVISLKLGNQATIEANGAVVLAPTKVKCPVGYTGYLDVAITEAVGNNIAAGRYEVEVQCTGKQQSITVAVTPAEHPFKKGVAWGSAELTAYGPASAQTVVDQHTIQLVK
jgi:hypothetical protein